MGRPFIVLGDQTDHGGQVIEASGMSFVHGRRMARVGDKVTCPKHGHGHTTVIVTGDPTMIVDGQPVARHGDKCACGATLIASQGVAGAGTAAAPAAPQRPNVETEIAKGLAVQQPARTRPAANAAYDRCFRLTDSLTGAPLARQPYRLEANGQVLEGMTDENGHTAPIPTGTRKESVSCSVLGEVLDG